jgi:hypothetical protein
VNLSTSSSTPETQPQPSSSEPAPSSTTPNTDFTSSISLENPSNALPTSINTVSVSSLGVPSSVGIPDSGISTLTPPSSSCASRTKLEILFGCWFSDFNAQDLLRVLFFSSITIWFLKPCHCFDSPTVSSHQTRFHVPPAQNFQLPNSCRSPRNLELLNQKSKVNGILKS